MAGPDLKKVRPLKAGIAVGSKDGLTGTLGWFAKVKASGEKVILGNEHIFRSANTKIGQPKHSQFSNCCCDCNVIGKTLVSGNNAKVDCGIVQLNDDLAASIQLEISNSLTSRLLLVRGIGTAKQGDEVFKIGISSGFTRGIVGEVNASFTSKKRQEDGTEVTVQKNDQLFVFPHPDEPYKREGLPAFSESGDSGAVVVNAQNEIVGLLEGSEKAKLADGRVMWRTTVNTISNVLDFFKSQNKEIELLFSPNTRKASPVVAEFQGELSLEEAGEKFQQQLAAFSYGRLLLSLFEKHWPEIGNLVNHVRAVTVTWHRNQGPAFLNHWLNSLQNTAYSIPQEIENVHTQRLLLSMADRLKHYGSEALQADIRKYGLGVISLFDQTLRMEDLFPKIKNKSEK